MLPRAARRRNALHHLRRSTEQLTLPWLYPSAIRSHSRLTRPENVTNSSSTAPSAAPRRPSFSQPRRHLATATDDVPLSSHSSWLSPLLGHTLFTEPAIMIQESQLTTAPSTKRTRSGDTLDEMMTKFLVLVKAREVEKASIILDRMSLHYSPGDPRFLSLHNQYIEAVVADMVENHRSGSTLKKALSLQTWFEVKLPQGHLKPNARTMAIMLRLALRIFHGSRRDRSVRRYWNMVQEYNFEVEVMSMTDLLTEQDLGEISQLCPNELPDISSMINFKLEQPFMDKTPSPGDSVRETKQKGLGLSSLRTTLSLLPDDGNMNALHDIESEEYKELQRMRQTQLEFKAVDTARERWQQEMEEMRARGIDLSGGGKSIGHLLDQWFNGMVIKIKEELKSVSISENSPKRSPGEKNKNHDNVEYLRVLPPDTLAAVTVMYVIQVFTRTGIEKGLKVPTIMTCLGKEIQNELIAQSLLAKTEQDKRRQKLIKQVVASRKKKSGNMQFKHLAKDMNGDEEIDYNLTWPTDVHAKLGGTLLSILYDCAKVPVTQVDPNTKEKVTIMEPAFQHSYEIHRGRKFGLLHTHPEITRRLVREAPNAMQAHHMPMLSEPKPWTGFDEGGFLAHPSTIIRTTPGDSLQKTYIQKALEHNGIPAVRAGLDILGKTAWIINNDVFDVMLEAWNSGNSYAKIPPLDPEVQLPPKPTDSGDAAALKAYNAKLREAENIRTGIHSQRCFINFQMEIARAYKNETFYLPHNMDFRGRAYPLPAYLNQMAADNARSLLLFKQGKRLGESGLRWLKIHLSNVHGFDKASLKEREEFTMEHLDDILDSANKGLHGRKWFLKSEDPWQCLAACCELRNALQLENPEEYLSRLPIHQDGSCNGLQHYAALGGDVEGAQHVNLEPGDRPSDIYTGVSDYVTEKVNRDAAAGHEIAKLLQGKIKRKIVKQTVMTNVYGVTYVGAVRQVRRQLYSHYPELADDHTFSRYIASSIFEALGSIFGGAHSIQYWLGDCATRICQSISPDQLAQLTNQALEDDSEKSKEEDELDPLKMFRSTIIWTTPLGLPVVQPYRAPKCRRIYTTLQTLNILQDSKSANVSKRKQLQAFPPNFIHSLDATHMMLSAIECNRQGLEFSAVHDSFWTHACDVDKMNVALRDCFIRMHSDDIVKRLASEFRARYDGHIFLAKIPSSSPAAEAIANYRKKKYGTMKKKQYTEELVLEHQRQTLLRSDDPELQERGRAMVTAASVFESLGGSHNDLAIASTLGQTGLGNITSDKTQGVFGNSIVDEKDPAVASLFSDLDPQYLDAEIDANARIDVVASEESLANADVEAEGEKKSGFRKSTVEWAWLPLQFRDIPKKGEFDVKRLKDSQYFFS